MQAWVNIQKSVNVALSWWPNDGYPSANARGRFCKATKPVHHNYGAHLETRRRGYQAELLQLLGAVQAQEKLPQWEAHAPQQENLPQWEARSPHKRSSRSEKPMLHNEE